MKPDRFEEPCDRALHRRWVFVRHRAEDHVVRPLALVLALVLGHCPAVLAASSPAKANVDQGELAGSGVRASGREQVGLQRDQLVVHRVDGSKQTRAPVAPQGKPIPDKEADKAADQRGTGRQPDRVYTDEELSDHLVLAAACVVLSFIVGLIIGYGPAPSPWPPKDR